MSKRSLPWLQFYPSDWLSDSVAGCSLAAQGLWLRMLFVAHNSQNYGYLEMDGRPIPDEQLFRRCGCSSVEEYRSLFAELQAAGVPSRTPEGVVYSRRMVRDQQERDATAARVRKHRERIAGNASVTPMSQGEVRSQSQKSESKEEKKDLAAKITPPSDPRQKPFFDFAFEAFRMKFLQPPSWGAAHAKGLQAFLKRSPQVDLAEWQRRYQFFLASTERFYEQQKGSLLFFAAKFDQFIDGPILEKGGKNGQLVTFAEKRTQKNADAIQRVLGRAEEASGDIRRALPPAHN